MNENEELNCIGSDSGIGVACDGPIQAYDGDEPCCEEPCANEPRNEHICLKSGNYEFRDFSVKKLNYGYIITVGCHKFAIEDKKKVIKLISEYVDDPNKVESKWWETKKV